MFTQRVGVYGSKVMLTENSVSSLPKGKRTWAGANVRCCKVLFLGFSFLSIPRLQCNTARQCWGYY